MKCEHLPLVQLVSCLLVAAARGMDEVLKGRVSYRIIFTLCLLLYLWCILREGIIFITSHLIKTFCYQQ